MTGGTVLWVARRAALPLIVGEPLELAAVVRHDEDLAVGFGSAGVESLVFESCGYWRKRGAVGEPGEAGAAIGVRGQIYIFTSGSLNPEARINGCAFKEPSSLSFVLSTSQTHSNRDSHSAYYRGGMLRTGKSGDATMTFRFTAILIAVLVGVTCSIEAVAQVAGGTIMGTVTDQTGAVVQKAHITIVNTATSITREVTANDDGAFSAPNLTPST